MIKMFLKVNIFNVLLFFIPMHLYKCQKLDFLVDVIENSNLFWEKYRLEEGIPGLVVGLDVNGEQLWVQNFGFSDIENHVSCKTDTVMRTGSVSKPIGTALVAKLVDNGLLDWDSDIHKYLSAHVFPNKEWNGETVNITLRQLISMTAGIRTTDELRDFRQIYDFTNVTQTVAMFAGDPLVAKPGTKFYYSNYGWQLIGAIVESVTNQTYETLMNEMFKEFGMNSSRMERREQIIPNRSRQYMKVNHDNHYTLKSAALLENLGRPLPHLPMGGVSASVPDLLRFSHLMITNYKNEGYLKKATVKTLWTPQPYLKSNSIDGGVTSYGMGWYITQFKNGYFSGIDYIHYSGVVAGTTVMIGLFPDLGVSMAAVANTGGLNNFDFTGMPVIKNFAAEIINNFLKNS